MPTYLSLLANGGDEYFEEKINYIFEESLDMLAEAYPAHPFDQVKDDLLTVFNTHQKQHGW